ncbi:MAG: hypothetical protein HQM15_09360 [Deltaproteobacteria bacterium]|nr:hypothetical protein [Deltaproteobacteria bacterium]
MKFKYLALLLGLNLVLVSPLSPSVWAAKKKHAVQGKASTKFGPREKKLLGWTSDYPIGYEVKNPNFFVRGSVQSFEKVEGKGKEYNISILPIEVLNNPHHYITLDHYKNGIPIKVELSSGDAKQLKVGGTIEYNFYTKEVDTGGTGHARLISDEIHAECKPYNIAPIAYLSKTTILEPEQSLNVLRGILLYEGKIEVDGTTKTTLASLRKSKNKEIAEDAVKAAEKLK